MYLTLSLNNNTSKEKVFSFCKNEWEKDCNRFLKILFFIRDKKQGKNQKRLFSNCMLWIYIHKNKVFYKIFSLIVGVYNENTVSDNVIKKMLKEDWSKFEEHLNEFISLDCQKPFKDNWLSEARKSFFENNILYNYGEWDDLIYICENIKNNFFWDEITLKKQKLFYFVINLFLTQLKKDKQLKINSNCVNNLYGIYKTEIENRMDVKEIFSFPLKQEQEKDIQNFQERYLFIKC